MKINHLFPGGKKKALTLSYDDGTIHDRRLVDIFNTHGLKGSFHLNSGFFDTTNYITKAEVQGLFKGHEISVHTKTHPFLNDLPNEMVTYEILEDRAALEALAGYPVRGMSYPYGTYSEETIPCLRAAGIVYSRTTACTNGFAMPDNFLKWNPTCHHKQDLLKVAEQFICQEAKNSPLLFYVWGHSYEFHNNNNWSLMEEFGKLIGGRDDIWYATNIEIVDYCQALKSLRFSVDGKIIHNPTATDIWLLVGGSKTYINHGETVRIK